MVSSNEQPGSRTARLRAATADRHAALESISGLPGTLVDARDLAAVLAIFHGFHAAFESRFITGDHWNRQGLAHVGRSRLARLRLDLNDHGLDDAAISALPISPWHPACNGTAARWGVAYVLEGSTMGGKLISRHVANGLTGGGATSHRYFQAYGDETARLWRRFTQRLDALSPSPAQESELESAARETFDCLARWYAARQAAGEAQSVGSCVRYR